MSFSNVSMKSDFIGMVASGLCLIHCVATPILFMAGTGLGLPTEAQPTWWGYLDPIFLVLSLLAVYWSVQSTPQAWMKFLFVALWMLLLLLVLNEKFELYHIAEEAIYVPTIGLILLHLYNSRAPHSSNNARLVKN